MNIIAPYNGGIVSNIQFIFTPKNAPRTNKTTQNTQNQPLYFSLSLLYKFPHFPSTKTPLTPSHSPYISPISTQNPTSPNHPIFQPLTHFYPTIPIYPLNPLFLQHSPFPYIPPNNPYYTPIKPPNT